MHASGWRLRARPDVGRRYVNFMPFIHPKSIFPARKRTISSDSKVRYIGFVTFVEGSNAHFTMKAYPGQYETMHA